MYIHNDIQYKQQLQGLGNWQITSEIAFTYSCTKDKIHLHPHQYLTNWLIFMDCAE